MQGGDIRNLFKTSKEVMQEAYENLLRYQNKEYIPALSGYPHIDEALIGGFFPQTAIAIGARPGVGKSYVAQKITENIMNPLYNPQCRKYLLVNFEFEMNPIDLLVRRLRRETGRSIKSFFESQSELEMKKILEVVEKERNDNIIYVPEPCGTQEFESAINHIATKNKDKYLIIFKVDHIGLVNKINGDAKRTIDEVVAIMNRAKRRYHNVFFLVISQLNREIEGRNKPKEQAPRLSDFYQSDELGQLCAVMVALNNPRRMGYKEYMQFPAEWYTSLDRFKLVDRKTSFRTEGLLFHHILKVRQISIEELENTIYPEVMPGYGWMYNEGGVRYINKERPPEAPKSYELVDDEDESPYN